jgi:hypothetical protein
MHRTFCAENTPVPRNHTWPILASAPSVNVHGITTYMPFAKIKWCCPYLLYCLSATLESFVEMHSRHHTLVLCKPWCTLHASRWKVETDSMGLTWWLGHPHIWGHVMHRWRVKYCSFRLPLYTLHASRWRWRRRRRQGGREECGRKKEFDGS